MGFAAQLASKGHQGRQSSTREIFRKILSPFSAAAISGTSIGDFLSYEFPYFPFTFQLPFSY